MILLSHPTGNTFSRALLGGLLERGLLGIFATTVAIDPRSPWLKLAPGGLRGELLRRRFDVPRQMLFTRPAREWARLAAGKVGVRALTRHETGPFCFDAIYSDLDKALAARLPDWRDAERLSAVYAYEDCAVEQFREARRLGLKRIYDLPIAYWEVTQRLLKEEAERMPDWARTLRSAVDSAAKCARKREEIELADVIVCPSRFVLESIPAGLRAERRAIVAEFGSPSAPARTEFKKPRKLRALFAGSMTQRKGLGDLFVAMKMLDPSKVELVTLGSLAAPLEFYRSKFPGFEYAPPRPHHQVLELMETCDALVLPSIVEGRALVQQEAMSRGLVLIATKNAGGEDLIDEGRTGFQVPIRSPEAIAQKLQWLADHLDALPEMKRAAQAKAAALTWERYVGIICASALAAGAEAPREGGFALK